MTKQELAKITQSTLTNKAIAARLRVMRAYMKEQLSEIDRFDLQLAAERLEMCDNPSIKEVTNYYVKQENPFESPIDNEL